MAGKDAILVGPRFVLHRGQPGYPDILESIASPPKYIYGIGNPEALVPGVAVVGARKATPYGISCAKLFSEQAALRNLTIVSGGARGCDQAAHEAALAVGAPTVVVFGGAADVVYPKSGLALFRRVIDTGGAVISEHAFGEPPLPAYFVQRNRIIAGLSRLLLIVEAGLPSGTFTTADFALKAGRDVCVVPGSIASASSRGSNRLIHDGATPVVDCETFATALDLAFAGAPLSMLPVPEGRREAVGSAADAAPKDTLLAALAAQPLSLDELFQVFPGAPGKLAGRISALELAGAVARGRDGRYQVCPHMQE